MKKVFRQKFFLNPYLILPLAFWVLTNAVSSTANADEDYHLRGYRCYLSAVQTAARHVRKSTAEFSNAYFLNSSKKSQNGPNNHIEIYFFKPYSGGNELRVSSHSRRINSRLRCHSRVQTVLP